MHRIGDAPPHDPGERRLERAQHWHGACRRRASTSRLSTFNVVPRPPFGVRACVPLQGKPQPRGAHHLPGLSASNVPGADSHLPK